MSNLERHAEFEMRKAGLYDEDADYYGMIPEAVMKLVKVHAAEGHSGMSHALTLQVFNRVVNFKTLTPISSNPDEWFKHDCGGPNNGPVWQNTRQSSCFSYDGGKTWHDIYAKKPWYKRLRWEIEGQWYKFKRRFRSIRAR